VEAAVREGRGSRRAEGGVVGAGVRGAAGSEKRKLLDFVVSECRWKGGELETVFREPFGALTA
jgi:hypothetical protein